MGGPTRTKRILHELGEAVRAFSRQGEGGGGSDPVERALARGREQGFREGVEHAAEEYETLAASLRHELAAALERIADLEERRNEEYRKLLRTLVLETVKRIVRARIDDDDPIATRCLEEAIAAFPSTLKLAARLHPDDVEHAARTLTDAVQRGRLELIADDSVGRGGCIVESEAGTIDALLETALEQMGDAIADERERA